MTIKRIKLCRFCSGFVATGVFASGSYIKQVYLFCFGANYEQLALVMGSKVGQQKHETFFSYHHKFLSIVPRKGHDDKVNTIY